VEAKVAALALPMSVRLSDSGLGGRDLEHTDDVADVDPEAFADPLEIDDAHAVVDFSPLLDAMK
jgi:hypothetical protein